MPRLISGELMGHSSTGSTSCEPNLKYPSGELRSRAHLQARTIAIVPGRRGMHLNLALEFKLGDAPQVLAQNFFLDFELMLVAGVLVVAASTAREIRTRRRRCGAATALRCR